MSAVRLLPAPAHRLILRLGHCARRVWYRRTRRKVEGCSVMARDSEGRFLLVRHSYGPAVWAFPGGGVRRHETPLNAAAREVREELGVKLVGGRRVALFAEGYLGGTNKVHLFTGALDGDPQIDGREITQARFFARDEFPPDISGTVAHRMRLFDEMVSRQGRRGPVQNRLS